MGTRRARVAVGLLVVVLGQLGMAGANAEPPVTRSYDVSFLLQHPRQRSDEKQMDKAAGENLARYVRHAVAAGSWEVGRQDGAARGAAAPRVAYREGRLIVVHAEQVHAQVKALLEPLKKDRNLQVHILARFLELSGDGLDPLKLEFHPFSAREGAPRSGERASKKPDLTYALLADDQVNTLLQALIKKRQGTLVTARLTCFNGQIGVVRNVINYSYVRRISSDEEPEPDGVWLDVQPFVHPGHRRITLVVQPQLRTLVALREFTYAEAKADEQATDLPTAAPRDLTAVVTVADGGTALLAGPALDAQVTQPKPGRRLVVLLTAETVPDIFEDE